MKRINKHLMWVAVFIWKASLLVLWGLSKSAIRLKFVLLRHSEVFEDRPVRSYLTSPKHEVLYLGRSSSLNTGCRHKIGRARILQDSSEKL